MDGKSLDSDGALFEVNVELGIERLAAIALLLTCLSHITAPGAWRALFECIAKSDAPGLATAAIHLPLGLLIPAFHNVWSWPEAVFTVLGWLLLVKGTLHLLFPQMARKSLAIPGNGKQAERRYRLAGVFMAPLAAVLMWLAWW